MLIHDDRRKMFESIGRRLVADLFSVYNGKTDTEIQGRAGEEAFRYWLSQQLPKRCEVLTGAVLSPNQAPTTERDCLIFDSFECAYFRQIGGKPDLVPIEGILASVEINTGHSGATYHKLLRDAEKLSEVGQLRGTSPLPRLTALSPVDIGKPTLATDVFVTQKYGGQPPLLLIFAQSLAGRIEKLAERIVNHNKKVSIGASVDGVFVLGKGMILHVESPQPEGWSYQRIAGHSLAFMEAEDWEVLLQMMMIIWNNLWKGSHSYVDLGRYYADKEYFITSTRPRLKLVSDSDYTNQREEGLYTFD